MPRFEKELPDWEAEGTKPPETTRKNGWQAKQKPPANWFNWFFNRAYQALKELQEKAALHSDLTTHTGNKSNPHTVTKAQVGLGNVENVSQASKVDFNNHVTNKENPHGTTKAQVGLGSVQDLGLSTQAEAESGTSNAKYMTPLSTKQAVTKQAQTVKITSDDGKPKYWWTTEDDVLEKILASPREFATFYAPSKAPNLPISNKSIRGWFHKTDAAGGITVWAEDYDGSVFTNFYDQNKGWSGWSNDGGPRISLGTLTTPIADLPQGHYEATVKDANFDAVQPPFKAGDYIAEIDVQTAGERKQIYFTANYQNRIFHKTIHTDKSDQGWVELSSVDLVTRLTSIGTDGFVQRRSGWDLTNLDAHTLVSMKAYLTGTTHAPDGSAGWLEIEYRDQGYAKATWRNWLNSSVWTCHRDGSKNEWSEWVNDVKEKALGKNDNAVSATKLQTARKIAGVAFDGTEDIAIPASNVGAYTKAEVENLINDQSNLLWEGAVFPVETTYNFKTGMKVRDQKSGIVLIWSDYDADTNVTNSYNYDFTYIPKFILTTAQRANLMIPVGTGNSNANNLVAVKELELSDTSIKGFPVNGTNSYSRDTVLRYIVGV